MAEHVSSDSAPVEERVALELQTPISVREEATREGMMGKVRSGAWVGEEARGQAERGQGWGRHQLEAVFQAVRDGIVVSDMAGNLVMVNRAAILHSGFETEEEVKQNLAFFARILELRDAEGRVVPVEEWPLTRVLRGEPVVSLEARMRRKDTGREWYFSFSGEPVRDEQGRQILGVVIARDITEQKRAEEALRQSEERLRQAVRVAGVAVFDHDQRNGTVHWSPEMRQIYGWRADEEPSLEKILQAIHPEERGAYLAAIQAAHDPAGNGVFAQECRLVRPDGSIRWVSTRAQTYFEGKEGEQSPARTIGAKLDVTARKLMEVALRKSRDRLAMALEAGQAGLMQWDLRTNTFHWSARTFELLGYAPDSFEPNYAAWKERIHPEDVSRVEGEAQRCIREGCRDLMLEFRIVRPEGSVHWVRWTGRFTFADGGSPESYDGILFSITALKQAEADMALAKEIAEEANRSKDQFIAVLSHELRTPLTPVLAALQIMQRDTVITGEQRALVELANRNVALETKLIDDLLDLTRIIRRKLELHPGPVDLHALLREVVRIFSGEIGEKRLRVSVELEAVHHHVQGDAVRLQQVFWNLIKNAIKFTPAGGSILLRTAGGAEREVGRVSVTVQDTGMGIEPELLPRLFNPFEQGNKGVTRQFGGLGLGLSICKGLVELHGGALVGASEGEGKGATFTVELPVSLEAERAGPREAPMAVAMVERHGGRILLVEDHKDSATILAKLLRGDGYEVCVAGSVEEALRAAEGQTFDLVISDIGLPDGSGLDLMRQLTQGGSARGIALSGYGTEEDIQKSLEAGFLAHLVKPVDIAALEEILARTLVRGRA